MQLVPIPPESLKDTAGIWGPFVEGIAKRQRCHLQQRLDDVYSGLVRLFIVWDEDSKRATALVGVMIMQRGDDRVGKIVWLTGEDRHKWLHLYPVLENFCRIHFGCNGGMEVIARKGWEPVLKKLGYKLIHVHYVKDFA